VESVENSKGEFPTLSTALGNPAKSAGFPHFHSAYGGCSPDTTFKILPHTGYGAKWLGRAQQIYKEKQTLAVARAKGYILKKREVIHTSEVQQVRLQFAVRR